MTDEPRLVVLGHSGFIGKNLQRHLASLDWLDVSGHSLPDIDLAERSQADLLAPYLTPDTCLVILAGVKRQLGDTLEIFQQNLAMLENLSVVLRSNPVRRVMFMSSAAVYGEQTHNTEISELTPVNPTSYYGIAKYTSERLLARVCAELDGVSLVCLRPPLIYGPGDLTRSYGPSGFAAAAANGDPIVMWGDGEERREFIFVEDLCRAIGVLVQSDIEGPVNIVSGHSHTYRDVVDVLRQRYPGLVVDERPRTQRKVDNAFLPGALASVLPATFCFTPLDAGIAKTLQSGEDHA